MSENKSEKNQKVIITEKDMEEMFGTRRKKIKIPSFFWLCLIFIGISIFVYVLINIGSFKNNLSYWFHNDFRNETASKYSFAPEVSNQTTNLNYQPPLPDVAENHLLIPKISVNAPIAWQINNTQSEVAKGLENGLINLSGTALPGEFGNVFITGHSSNYLWAKGDYKTVFSLLDKMVAGDAVYIKYKNITYLYKVSSKKVVKPTDLSVLNQGNQSVLTLMTCTPVGTSLNRLIVIADQVYPDPEKNMVKQKNGTNNSLPNIR